MLPAGTYVFKLADSMTDRHIVQVFTADGSQILATLLAIPDHRLTTTDQTVISVRRSRRRRPRSDSVPGSIPAPASGQEFVYPKSRAMQLAAMAEGRRARRSPLTWPTLDALKTAPIVGDYAGGEGIARRGGHPDDTERADRERRDGAEQFINDWRGWRHGNQPAPHASLPKTASALPLIIVFGLGSIGVAFGLMAFGKRAMAPVHKP